MALIDDPDYAIEIVNAAQQKRKEEMIIKTQNEEMEAKFRHVERQKLERERKKHKQTVKKVFALALVLGCVGGYVAQPYVSGFATVQKNEHTIAQAFELDTNNALYVHEMKVYQDGGVIKYLEDDEKPSFFKEVERIPDVSDPVTLDYLKGCVEIIDGTCKYLTDGEKGYIDLLTENALVAEKKFKQNVTSLGSFYGVPLEEIYTQEELENMRTSGLGFGGK